MNDILEVVKADLRSRRGRPREVAEATGVTLKTLRNLMYIPGHKLSYDNTEKLRALYTERETA